MFLAYATSSLRAIIPMVILGGVGYFLVKRQQMGEACLLTISRFSMDIALPALIFYQLLKDFSFSRYPRWWIFPLASIFITFLGLGVAALCAVRVKGHEKRMQFLSLVGFQNSGFLPLMLFALIVPKPQADVLFVYLFLFLIGFNAAIFSLGVAMLVSSGQRRFPWKDMLNPPVIATVASMLLVFLGINRFIPAIVLTPVKMLGDCTVPLAMVIVGGNLALIKIERMDHASMAMVVALKLILLPALGLIGMVYFKLPALVGLLVLVELAVPTATTLSVIIRTYGREDHMISHGIFVTHLASIVTLPVFLSLYFSCFMLQ